MKRILKLALLAVAGVALIVPTTTTTADAASRVKVLSTSKVAKKAYHSQAGNVYTNRGLKHRKYQMKKYKYTTWYTYKRSVLKVNGKKRAYVYIKSGKKAGWIASASLKKGKAPKSPAAKRAARLFTTYRKYNQIARTAGDSQIRSRLNVTDLSYYQMGNAISFSYEVMYPDSMSVSEVNKDRQALLGFYNLFKGRFKGNTRRNLDIMAKDLKNLKLTSAKRENAVNQMGNLANTLGDLVEDLN